jgi:hypothetical protein
MPLESSTPHTGDFVRDGKASGQEAREPPTTRQGPHAESEGAEESADGNAGHTGHAPQGEGPEPLEVWRTKGGGDHSPQRTRQRFTSGVLVQVGDMG